MCINLTKLQSDLGMPTYDTALIAFCQVITGAGLQHILANSWFVRTPAGQLTIVVPDTAVPDIAALRVKVAAELGHYSSAVPDNVARRSEHPLGESGHLALPEIVVSDDGLEQVVRVIDQRANGQDWLRLPAATAGSSGDRPPRMVFWSLKGGVGRTTALSVLAASLANDGLNVLVVDLDLEAPGVGDQLLDVGGLPSYGVLDYLAEMRLGGVASEDMFDRAVGTSTLTRGAGLVHVCPAAGALTHQNPANFLGKLFRAYGMQTIEGVETTFADRIDQLINGLTGRSRYDAVLIDARAGLSESTAASILNLGGDVLLFGHNTPQTFAGYRYAFAHLSRFVLDGRLDWVYRMKMVHAKAPLNRVEQAAFRDGAFDLFSEYLYGADDETSFSLDDVESPHFAWVIGDDTNFRDFNPIERPDLLDVNAVAATFGPFIKASRERLRI